MKIFCAVPLKDLVEPVTAIVDMPFLPFPDECICAVRAGEEPAEEEVVRWADAGSSTEYEIVPRRTFEREGRRCREVVTTVLRSVWRQLFLSLNDN